MKNEHEQETALALAQSVMQGAINDARLSRVQLAKRLGVAPPWITRVMSGSHNLTVKTLARVLAACGFEIEFKRKWIDSVPPAKTPHRTHKMTKWERETNQLARKFPELVRTTRFCSECGELERKPSKSDRALGATFPLHDNLKAPCQGKPI